MFGIGAQRAGTGWLGRLLRRHPDCALPPLKEVHYFDVAERGAWNWGRRRILRRLGRNAQQRAQAPRGSAQARRLAAEAADLRRLDALFAAGREDVEGYRRYLLEGRRARVVADITPAYGLLSADRLGRMAGLGERVRFLLVVRDPVDRAWAQIRLDAARGGAGRHAARAHRLLDEYLAGRRPEIDARSDYAGMLARLAEAVRPGDRLVLFHEELIGGGPALGRLAAFLGIRPLVDLPGGRVGAGPRLALGEDARRALAQRLAPQYEAVRAWFGRRALPARWSRNMAEVL